MAVKQTRVLRLVIIVLAILSLAVAGVMMQGAQQVAHAARPSVTGLHVSGKQLLNGNNQVVRALGADRSGTEFECASSGGNGGNPFDGPSDSASVQAMASWDMTAVRVPLNEDCWLGINGFPLGMSQSTYQQDIINYVNLLNQNNMMVILDLHWNAPGSTQATSQQIMPDLDHASNFWTSVANTFKNNSSVIFDLYNEPHPQNWSCWLNGSTSGGASPCSDVSFAVAGMQNLVNTVRNTGANNVLMLGGLSWANDLSQWLQNEPGDPDHNLAASFHLYNFNACNSTSCWNAQVAPVAQKVPVITGELGENDCADSFITGAMNWFDQNGVSYLGWAWVVDSCSGFPSLITNYNGTPSAFGQGLQQHLQSLAGGGGSTPTPTPTPTNAKYTFEDGGTDGWGGTGHIVSVANSTSEAHNGTHSLQVVLYSANSSNFPSVAVGVGSGGPTTGQTYTAWFFLANGSVNVSAKLYVQDSQYHWYIGSLTSLTQGQWTELSFTIPSISGAANAVGVQFLASPTNTNATVYLDTVNWG